MPTKAQKEHLKNAQRAASSPEARAKAVATWKKRKAEKEALLATLQNESENQIPLDAIPDREPRRKYKPRASNSNDAKIELAMAMVMLVNKILGETK